MRRDYASAPGGATQRGRRAAPPARRAEERSFARPMDDKELEEIGKAFNGRAP
jgi:hypothetical protein